MRKKIYANELLDAPNLMAIKGGATKKVTYRLCGGAYVKGAKSQTINFTNEAGVQMSVTINSNNTLTVNTPTETLKMSLGN